MMKLLSVAALGFVAAADVPVFSSNDDYDEINLNIRLLASHNTSSEANTTTAGFKVNGEANSQWTGATDATSTCAEINGPTAVALQTATSAASGTITSCGASATRRMSTTLAITQAYELGFTTAAGASAATTLISSEGFAATFQSALNTALSQAGSSLSATITFSEPIATDGTGATVPPATSAPPAAAAPSPSPSSDASMIKATTAIFAAVVASLF